MIKPSSCFLGLKVSFSAQQFFGHVRMLILHEHQSAKMLSVSVTSLLGALAGGRRATEATFRCFQYIHTLVRVTSGTKLSSPDVPFPSSSQQISSQFSKPSVSHEYVNDDACWRAGLPIKTTVRYHHHRPAVSGLRGPPPTFIKGEDKYESAPFVYQQSDTVHILLQPLILSYASQCSRSLVHRGQRNDKAANTKHATLWHWTKYCLDCSCTFIL